MDDTSPVLVAIFISTGLAIASALTAARAAKLNPAELLDRDSRLSRVVWASDVVTLTGVLLAAVATAVARYPSRDYLWPASVAAAAAIPIAAIAWKSESDFINRYPRSFYNLVTRYRYEGPGRVTPGILLGVVLPVALAAT